MRTQNLTQLEIPHLFVLGIEKFGALPSKQLVAANAISDLVFQQFSITNYQFYQKSKKLEGLFSITRVISLIWNVRHLFQEFSKRVTFFPNSMDIAKLSVGKVLVIVPFFLAGSFGCAVIGCVAAEVIDETSRFFRGVPKAEDIHEELLKEDIYLKEQDKLSSKNIKICWRKSTLRNIDTAILFFQTITSIFVAILSKTKEDLLLVAVNATALYKMSHKDFLSIAQASAKQVKSSFKTSNTVHNLWVKFIYTTIFLPKTNNETCAVCIEDQPKQYYVCKHHSLCTICKVRFLIEKINRFNLVNEVKCNKKNNYRILYEAYFNEKLLPSCPQGCGKIENELNIKFKDNDKFFMYESPNIHFLNYQIGEKIKVIINAVEGYEAEAQLDNGSIVYFTNINPYVAHQLKQTKKVIEAIIEGVTTESGYLYLKCRSKNLPEVVGSKIEVRLDSIKKFEGCNAVFGVYRGKKICFLNVSDFFDESLLGKSIESTINGFDEEFVYCQSDLLPMKESYGNKKVRFEISGYDQEKGLFFGHLDSGERTYYYPSQNQKNEVGIGSKIEGFVFNELISMTSYSIECLPYFIGQEIEVILVGVDSRGKINGLTDKGDRIKYHFQGEDFIFKRGQEINVTIRKFIIDNHHNIELICSNQEHEIRSSSSSSGSD